MSFNFNKKQLIISQPARGQSNVIFKNTFLISNLQQLRVPKLVKTIVK